MGQCEIQENELDGEDTENWPDPIGLFICSYADWEHSCEHENLRPGQKGEGRGRE